jgi:hypothetical protein
MGWSWVSVDEPIMSPYQDERISNQRATIGSIGHITKDSSEIITDVEATSVGPVVDLTSSQTDLITLAYAVLIGGATLACPQQGLRDAWRR